MEISPGWVGAGATVASLVGGGLAAWLRGIDKAQEVRIAEVKNTQRTLFEKYDRISADIQAERVHVAETYVNREVLREQLAPINKALEKIDADLREMRK